MIVPGITTPDQKPKDALSMRAKEDNMTNIDGYYTHTLQEMRDCDLSVFALSSTPEYANLDFTHYPYNYKDINNRTTESSYLASGVCNNLFEGYVSLDAQSFLQKTDTDENTGSCTIVG